MSAALSITPAATPDRRNSGRSTLVCKALLYADDGTAPLKVFLANISMTGIGLRSTRALMPGSSYRLSIEAGPIALRSRVRVVRCTPRPDQSFEAGCALDPSDLAHGQRPTGTSAAPARLRESISRNPTRGLSPR